MYRMQLALWQSSLIASLLEEETYLGPMFSSQRESTSSILEGTNFSASVSKDLWIETNKNGDFLECALRILDVVLLSYCFAAEFLFL